MLHATQLSHTSPVPQKPSTHNQKGAHCSENMTAKGKKPGRQEIAESATDSSIDAFREYILSELVENAITAIVNMEHWSLRSNEYHSIEIVVDRYHRVLTVRDTGDGMTAEQLREHLGTHISTKKREFVATYKKGRQDKLNTSEYFEGTGLYVAYLIAEAICVLSAPNDDDPAPPLPPSSAFVLGPASSYHSQEMPLGKRPDPSSDSDPSFRWSSRTSCASESGTDSCSCDLSSCSESTLDAESNDENATKDEKATEADVVVGNINQVRETEGDYDESEDEHGDDIEEHWDADDEREEEGQEDEKDGESDEDEDENDEDEAESDEDEDDDQEKWIWSSTRPGKYEIAPASYPGLDRGTEVQLKLYPSCRCYLDEKAILEIVELKRKVSPVQIDLYFVDEAGDAHKEPDDVYSRVARWVSSVPRMEVGCQEKGLFAYPLEDQRRRKAHKWEDVDEQDWPWEEEEVDGVYIHCKVILTLPIIS